MIILRNYGLNQGHILATNYPELAEQWNYEKNGTLTPWMVTTGSNKKVLCFSQDGQFLGAYPSVKDAARENGTVKSEVRAVCKGRRKADKGIVYRYADQQEKEPVQDEEKLRDVLNQEISVGDEVMFIKHTPHKTTKTLHGTVTGITNHSLLIGTGDGESCRIIASRDDPVFLPKVLGLRPRPERPEEGELDASGYPIREGDPVVYMPLLVSNRCKGFEFGTVKKAAGKTWEVNGSRKNSDRMVVVNW